MRKGFTLVELLIVVSLIILISTPFMFNAMGQFKKGYDAKRKDDLKKLQEVMEHYSNDNGCYPDPSLWSCTSTVFAPYNMGRVICDPESKQPYYYEPLDVTNLCAGYRLYAILRGPQDGDIARLGCNRPQGCGVVGHPEYNYGVAVGAAVAQ